MKRFLSLLLVLILTLPVPAWAALVSCWELDEAASSTRVDAVVASGNNLTDNGGVGQAAGKIGNAITNTTTTYLSRADNASLSTGDIDFSFTTWVYLSENTTYHIVFSKGWTFPQDADSEYILYFDQTVNQFNWQVRGSSTDQVGANTFGAPATDTWIYLYVFHDSVNNLIGISANNGTVDTVAHTTGVNDGNRAFALGASILQSLYWNGRIDVTKFYKHKLTAGEVTADYNSGAGLSCAAVIGGGAVKRRSQTIRVD
jgi:hypothetical protein